MNDNDSPTIGSSALTIAMAPCAVLQADRGAVLQQVQTGLPEANGLTGSINIWPIA
jgi:hypothetical protein